MIPILVALALNPAAPAAELLKATHGVAGRELEPLEGAEEAEAFVEERDWKEAARRWRRLALSTSLDRDERALAHTWSAVSHVQASDYDAAQGELLGAMLLDPGEPRTLLVAAWLLTEVGGGKEAVRLLRDFPDDHPDAVGAELLRMRAWTMEGRQRRALRVRLAAEEAGRTDAWFWLEAGMEAAFKGDPETLVLLERATRAEGSGVLHASVYLRVLYELGLDEEAAAVAVAAANRFGDDPDLRVTLEWLLAQPEGASRFAEALPPDGVPHFMSSLLGTWFWQEGQPDRARPLLESAAADPEAPARLLSMWARSVDSTEGPAAAAAVLLQAVERFPQQVALRGALVDTALRSREPELTCAAADRLGAQAPLRLVMAAHEAALDLGDGEGALRWARLAGQAGLPSWDASHLEARALARLGRGAEALAAYEFGLAGAPDDPQLLGDFAQFLLAPPADVAAQPERARLLAERALSEAGGDDSRFLGVLAEACWQTGDRTRALNLQQRAVDLAPSDSELTRRLHRYEAGRP